MRRLRRARVSGGRLLIRASQLVSIAGAVASATAVRARCSWLVAVCVCVCTYRGNHGGTRRMSRSGATFGFAVARLSGRPSFSGVLYALGAA